MALASIRVADAFQALHRILIRTRSLAGTGADSRRVVGIMDDAEYLVILMIKPDNEDERFRLCVEGMAQKYPELAGLTALIGERSDDEGVD